MLYRWATPARSGGSGISAGSCLGKGGNTAVSRPGRWRHDLNIARKRAQPSAGGASGPSGAGSGGTSALALGPGSSGACTSGITGGGADVASLSEKESDDDAVDTVCCFSPLAEGGPVRGAASATSTWGGAAAATWRWGGAAAAAAGAEARALAAIAALAAAAAAEDAAGGSSMA